MRVLILLIFLALGGCISFSSSSPRPPASNTVLLPPGATVVCSDGTRPPCRWRSEPGQRAATLLESKASAADNWRTCSMS